MKIKREPIVCSKCDLKFQRHKQFMYHCRHSHVLTERIECGSHFHYSKLANYLCNGTYKAYINELKAKVNVEPSETAIPLQVTTK